MLDEDYDEDDFKHDAFDEDAPPLTRLDIWMANIEFTYVSWRLSFLEQLTKTLHRLGLTGTPNPVIPQLTQEEFRKALDEDDLA